MRTLFIIPLVLLSLVSFPSWGLTFDDLVKREGLYYQRFTDVPFTGEIGEGLIRGNYKNGKREGTWVVYHENGQLKYKGEYKNGKEEGPWFSYDDTGQLRENGEYKDGEREGTWVFFNRDGTKRMFGQIIGGFVLDEGSGVYRNGEKVSD